MQIEIKNFMGIESAIIPLSNKPLAVIGPNAIGKSSIWLAIAGLLSRNTNPMGLSAVSGKPYIHDDHDQGEVALIEDGLTLRQWTLLEQGIRVMPEAETDALKHVLGLTDFIKANPAERVQAWEECFLPPNKELVAMIGTELHELIAEEAVVEDVLRELELQPWVDVCKTYESKRREIKRQWEDYTGARYGIEKATTWTPRGWKSEWDHVTVAEANTRLEEWREALRMLQGVQMIQETDAERAAEAKEEIPDLEKHVEILIGDLEAAKQQARIHQKDYDAIRNQGIAAKTTLANHDSTQPKQEETVPCPACSEALVIGAGRKLFRAADGAAFQSILSSWNTVRGQMQHELDDLRERGREILVEKQPVDVEVAALHEKHIAAGRRLHVCRAAAKKGDGQVETEEVRRHLSEAEQAVDDAKVAGNMIENMVSARNAHVSVLSYDAIAKALGPAGIRSRAIQGNLGDLERYLAEIADVSGWPQVSLGKTYEVKIGRRFGKLSSESEQWRANFMLQCAIALVKKEPRVLVDRGDILLMDAKSARQLWRLGNRMAEMGVYPIVCATGTIQDTPEFWQVVHYERERPGADGWRLREQGDYEQGDEDRLFASGKEKA